MLYIVVNLTVNIHSIKIYSFVKSFKKKKRKGIRVSIRKLKVLDTTAHNFLFLVIFAGSKSQAGPGGVPGRS